MLRLAAIPLAGQRVLTIETDYILAAEMAHEIQRSGGIVAGAVPELWAALAIVDSGLKIDCAMIDTYYTDDCTAAELDALRQRGVNIVFVTGFDNWFEDDEEDDLYQSAWA